MIPTVFIPIWSLRTNWLSHLGNDSSVIYFKCLKMHFSKAEETVSCSVGCFFCTGCLLGFMAVLKAGDSCRLEVFLASQDLGSETKNGELGQCLNSCWPTRFSWDSREIKMNLTLWRLFLKKFLISLISPSVTLWAFFCHCFLLNHSSHIPSESIGGVLKILKREKAALSCLQNILKL